MKYRIRKFSDAFDLTQESATEMAKEKLLETKFYAAVYGKKIKGKQIFHEPLLVNKDVLEEMKHEIIEEDPEAGALYVLYRSSLTDAPLYEVEEDKGYIDIPDEEVEEFVKKRMIEIANNSRLFEKYKKDLIDILEEDLQDYAEREFYEKGRGEKL